MPKINEKKMRKKYTKKTLDVEREVQPQKGNRKRKRFAKLESEGESLKYDQNYLNKYAQMNNKDEYYARRYTGDEYYRKENDQEIYARKLDGDQFYAEDANKRQFIAAKLVGEDRVVEDYIIDHNGDESYPFDEFQRDYWYVYPDGTIKVAKMHNDRERYPKYKDPITGEDIEFLFRIGNSYVYLMDGDKQRYPLNRTLNLEIYPKNEEGDEFYLLDEDNQPYYIVRNNIEIYATDKDGKNIFLSKDGEDIYAKHVPSKMEIYPRTSAGGAEFYKMKDGTEIAARIDVDRLEQYYATDSDGNEIYPKSYIFAMDDESESEGDGEDIAGDIVERELDVL